MTEDEYEYFEAAVIGSGFGGSIAAIELAKVFRDLNKANPKQKKEVCILERGIWYMSPEAWLDPENEVTKFIRKTGRPYKFWAMPDNSKGLSNLFAMLRMLPLGNNVLNLNPLIDFILRLLGKRINPRGLYDVKNFKESFATVASGVGGGSLVYSNVTISPEPEILDLEYKEGDRGGPVANPNDVWKPRWKIPYDDLEPYMMYAKYKFIEVSKIYSVQAGYYNDLMWLPKTRELLKAVDNSQHGDYTVTFELADLSITEAPELEESKSGLKKKTPKFCLRQGRCNFGCLPGARHSLNKKLVGAINDDLPICIKELAEVTLIEPAVDSSDGYRVHYMDRKTNELTTIHARTLILAAGTYGTTGLILQSKKQNKFTDVSENVGTRLSLNGDAFGFVLSTKNPVFPTRGPIDTAHVRFKKNETHRFTIEDATIPRMVAGTFASAIEGYIEGRAKNTKERLYKPHFRNISLFFWNSNPLTAIGIEHLWNNNTEWIRFVRVLARFLNPFGLGPKKWNPSQNGSHAWLPGSKEHEESHHGHTHKEPEELDDDYRFSRVFFFACMGIDRANGVAKWGKNDLEVNWHGLAKDPIYDEIKAGMKMLGESMVDNRIMACLSTLTKKKEEEYLVLEPMKELFGQVLEEDGEKVNKLFSLHPLGGCPMETYPPDEEKESQDKPNGAVDTHGALLRNNGKPYPNLYVVDGSIIPTALGVNPSLTISGLAFKIIDNIVREYRNDPSLENPVPKDILKNSVKKGETHTVTFREISKQKNGIFTIATVDPEDGKEFGNIVYVRGHHMPNDRFGTNNRKGKVDIMRVQDRFAEGQFLQYLPS